MTDAWKYVVKAIMFFHGELINKIAVFSQNFTRETANFAF